MAHSDDASTKKSKAVQRRRGVYRCLVAGMLAIITCVIAAVLWYALYCYIMPSLNSFLFGAAGGAEAIQNIDERVVPYTVAALWFIPTLLACATLNVICWKVTVLWVRLMKRVHKYMMNKFDKVNSAEAEKGDKK